MKSVLTARGMRITEQAYMDTGVSSLALMERAASALADAILSALGGAGGTCVFACGPGGNGGDGYAAARLFAEAGGRAIVLKVRAPGTRDARHNYERALKSAFACVDIDSLDTLPRPDAWADCVYGTGLTRDADEDCARLYARFERDRALGSLVISCDIPSGLDADSGVIRGACARADITVSFHALKRGHLLGAGPDVCGDVRVVDIGIPRELSPSDAALLIEPSDAARALPARKRTAHKNEFGHLLIFAGSRGMAGAACVCALAALKSGVGLVTVACPESILNIVQTLAPCAMCAPLEERNGALAPGAADELARIISSKSAVVLGPGLGACADAECVKRALQSGLPAVIDADALNAISRAPYLKALLSERHVLTPHPGEAARLLSCDAQCAVERALALRELGAQVVYKGATTVICTDRVYLSASGCSGMAKGGSGDALAGVLGALLAQGVDARVAPWLASEIHGRAGELARAKYGDVAMSPLDLVGCLSEAFMSYAHA